MRFQVSIQCNFTQDAATCAYTYAGDFHFLWECAQVLLIAFWGKVSDPGTLCNLRNYMYINCILVDKAGKTFNVIDEFLLHTFKAHLIAAVCEELKIESYDANIQHDNSLQWLKK